ncbi:hypothetical protein H9P43_002137 [Blastocladiella emersonii ATCC 22665]|nr:hypothetical protein H9P43_002137 [Blastocladiella emersonii ATCC 22665]
MLGSGYHVSARGLRRRKSSAAHDQAPSPVAGEAAPVAAGPGAAATAPIPIPGSARAATPEHFHRVRLPDDGDEGDGDDEGGEPQQLDADLAESVVAPGHDPRTVAAASSPLASPRRAPSSSGRSRHVSCWTSGSVANGTPDSKPDPAASGWVAPSDIASASVSPIPIPIPVSAATYPPPRPPPTPQLAPPASSSFQELRRSGSLFSWLAPSASSSSAAPSSVPLAWGMR